MREAGMNSMSDEVKKLIFIAAGVGVFVGSIFLVKWVRKRQKAEEEAEIIPVVDISENSEEPNPLTMEKSSLDNGFKSKDPPINYWKAPDIQNAETFHFQDEGPAEDDNAQDPDYPYMITVDEFSEGKEGYDQIGLYYFADRVLSDKNFNPIDGIDSKIGFDSLNHFSPTVDTIYVRNDRLKIDYEIILDERRFIDAAVKKSGDASGGSD